MSFRSKIRRVGVILALLMGTGGAAYAWQCGAYGGGQICISDIGQVWVCDDFLCVLWE